MADKKAVQPAQTTQSVTDFLKNPAESYAKVKAGERLVLTGADGKEEMVIFPGSISEYADK
jgi:hypothetical protein